MEIVKEDDSDFFRFFKFPIFQDLLAGMRAAKSFYADRSWIGFFSLKLYRFAGVCQLCLVLTPITIDLHLAILNRILRKRGVFSVAFASSRLHLPKTSLLKNPNCRSR
jgi:hypothetical protein